MDDEVKNREDEAGGLDDLLDEILQKNMEEEVQKGEESVASRADSASDSVNANVSADNRLTGNPLSVGNVGASEQAVANGLTDDRVTGASSVAGNHTGNGSDIGSNAEMNVNDSNASREQSRQSVKTEQIEQTTTEQSASEQKASNEDDSAKQSPDKPTPEEYLDDVFGDTAESDKKDDEDIRVIEVEVGSEDDTRITKKDILSMLAYVLIIFLLTFVIVHYVGQRTRVSGSSMENTLSNGDNLIVDKLSYRFHDPERFDVIIFPFQYETDTYYIKRIIGLPGETVQIGTDGTIYINGEVLDEDYGLETIQDPGMAIDPIVLGEDEYFVLGDNRNNSSDSRFGGVGKVKRDTIIGRAWIRIYPFDEIKKL